MLEDVQGYNRMHQRPAAEFCRRRTAPSRGRGARRQGPSAGSRWWQPRCLAGPGAGPDAGAGGACEMCRALVPGAACGAGVQQRAAAGTHAKVCSGVARSEGAAAGAAGHGVRRSQHRLALSAACCADAGKNRPAAPGGGGRCRLSYRMLVGRHSGHGERGGRGGQHKLSLKAHAAWRRCTCMLRTAEVFAIASVRSPSLVSVPGRGRGAKVAVGSRRQALDGAKNRGFCPGDRYIVCLTYIWYSIRALVTRSQK